MRQRRLWPPFSSRLGIGFVGVSLAFGLTVLTMAYAIGHVSRRHLNPAVSVWPVRRRLLPGQGT